MIKKSFRAYFTGNGELSSDNAAQEAEINTVLFNRDNEVYCGDIVYNFHQLDSFLKIDIYYVGAGV